MKSLKQIGCALVVLCLPIGLCQAQYTLTSGNSSVAINASGANAGVTSWIVNGQNQLNDQWFWYRIGSTGPEYAINTIGTPTVDLISSSILQTTYVSSQIQATILYSLVGGSAQSGTSDLSEQIAIQNLTSSSISFHFFQYADFNLGGTANNDSGQVTKAGNKYGGINQLDGTCMVSENVYTAVSQPASHYQIGTGSTILNSLNNDTPTTLNDTSVGSGNINWGLEWDVTIASGGTLLISKDLNIQGVAPGPVPEPSTWALIILAAAAGGLYKYRTLRRLI